MIGHTDLQSIAKLELKPEFYVLDFKVNIYLYILSGWQFDSRLQLYFVQ